MLLVLNEYEEKIKSKSQPEKKKCPKCNANPGKFNLHERRLRKILILEKDTVQEREIFLLRWKCPLCLKTWTEYPHFVEAYKRYVKPTLILKAFDYVKQKTSTYRNLTSNGTMPIWYEKDLQKEIGARSIWHSTLYRWVGWLGSFVNEISLFMGWLEQKFSDSVAHQKLRVIFPGKYRSQERKVILENVGIWSSIAEEFEKKDIRKIFLQFAPHANQIRSKIAPKGVFNER
ncbi:hypothetical protein KKC45_02590 [Patescibacteria group bacterium]|nr:hypothetical protein [Patescibacteria group bacterium]